MLNTRSTLLSTIMISSLLITPNTPATGLAEAAKMSATFSVIAGACTLTSQAPSKVKYGLSGAACAFLYGLSDIVQQERIDFSNFRAVGGGVVLGGILGYIVGMRGAVKEQLSIVFNGRQQPTISEYSIPRKRFAAWAVFTGALCGGILTHHLSR